MGITTPTIKKTNITRSNSSTNGKNIIRQKGTLKIPNKQRSEYIEQDSETTDKSGPYGFIVHDCNNVEFGFGNFTPEENLYMEFPNPPPGVSSTRNACFILKIALTNETCTATYKFLNDRTTDYNNIMAPEYPKMINQYTAAKENLESLLYNPTLSLDQYNAAKTIEKIIKFKLIQPNEVSCFFVSIDAPKSPIGSERWHQDSTNVAIVSDKIVGNPPQRWRKWVNELGITHKNSQPINSDFVLIEYLNEGVSTTVEIKGNVNTSNPNNIARFNTIPGSVILIENPGRKHTAPYICKSNSVDPNSVDRSEGNKSLQIIMDDKLERTLYRTQLTKINENQLTNVSNLIPDAPAVNINVNVKDIIPFNEIQMTEYCTCKRSDYAEYGGKRNKRKSNKTRRKNKRRRSKRRLFLR
jgi:hypothetical protein